MLTIQHCLVYWKILICIMAADQSNINDYLCRILEWLHVNKLCLNANKSKFMLFHSPNKIIDIPSIEINGTNVDCVDSFNFLGLLLDKHLNWKGQTSKIAN